jgi:hypothetical protein
MLIVVVVVVDNSTISLEIDISKIKGKDNIKIQTSFLREESFTLKYFTLKYYSNITVPILYYAFSIYFHARIQSVKY